MGVNAFEDTLEQVAQAPENPYAETLQLSTAASETAMRVTQQQAQAIAPDRAADILRLSASEGLPPEVVERNFDAIKTRAAVVHTPYAQLLREAPALTAWAAQSPYHAALAKDDHPQLSTMERVLGVGRNLVGAAGAGLVEFAQGLYGAEQAAGDVLGATGFAAQAGQRAQAAGSLADRLRGPQTGAGLVERGIYGGVESLGNMGPSLVLGAISGGVALLSSVGVATGGQTYAQARVMQPTPAGAGQIEAGTVDLFAQPTVTNADGSISTVDSFSVNIDGREILLPTVTPDGRHLSQDDAVQEYERTGRHLGIFATPDAATAYATRLHEDYAAGKYKTKPASVGRALAVGTIQGAIEVATEFIPAHRLLGDLAAKSGLLKTLAHQLAPEILGEEIATVFQDLNEWALLPANKDRTWADYLHERPSAAAATLISTITAVGATTIVAHGTQRMIEKLGESAAESKTIERLPEAAQAFITQATHDGPVETVYAPIETFTEYWQSKGLDPAQIAQELTGDADAFARATATGEDLAIPTAAYAVKIAPTEHNAFFATELRLSPEAMNGREAKVFEQELQKQATDVPTPDDQAAADETQQITDTIASPDLDAQLAAATAPAPETPPEAFLDRIEREAVARIQARGTFSGARLSAGIPLDDLTDIVLIGSVKIVRGVSTFAAWSKTMLAEYGDRIRPHLRQLYAKSLTLAGQRLALSSDATRAGRASLASDDAVAEVERHGIIPLDPTLIGMTEPQIAPYLDLVAHASDEARTQLQDLVLRDLQREQTAEWAAAKKIVRAEVTAEIHAQPVYRARAAILRGTNPDGTALFEAPLKVADETAAELFGFSSADELQQALKAAPPMPQAIAAETQRRMVERHGDLLQAPAALKAAAEQAVFGAGRQRVIQAELKALQRGIAGGVIPPVAVVQHAAEQRIAAMRVRDIRPGLFLMAAQRASAKAFDLVATAQDRIGAVQAKQQELFSLALYREALRVQDLVASREAWRKRLDTDAARARLGKAGGDFLDQWDGFNDRYEFKPVTQKALDRRASLRDWIATLEAQGLPVDLPASVLDDSKRVNYQELTVEQFVGVTDAMKQIQHLARLKNKLLTAVNKRTFDDAIAETVSSIREKNVGKSLPLEFLPKDLKARKVSDWFASHTKIATYARALDGYADGGPVWEYVIRPLNEAATREATMNHDATVQLSALMRTAYTGRELGKLHDLSYVPAIAGSLSKEARLAVALNWGNEGNRQRIRDGRQWSDSQVQAILDTLDARDWTFVQGVWDFVNSYWPAIAAKQQRVVGIAPEKVEATPVSTRFGTFAGGYYPLAYDPRLSARAGSFLDASEATLQKQAAYVKATTKRGHTEARAARVSEPVRLELSVLYGHVEQVIHDLSHHEMLIDVGRVLGNKAMQQAIYETQGDQVYQQLKGALKDIAYGTRAAADTFERSLNFIRQGTTVAGLAWNVWTAVQQPMGVFNGMARVGPSWVLKGMTRMLRDAASMENTARWVNTKSKMMTLRDGTQQREITELRNTLSHPGGWFDNALRTVTADHLTRQDITDSYFTLIAQAQRLADLPTWIGQYEKSRAAGEADARAVALADQAVLDAQGGGQIKDLAQAQRGAPLLKLFTNFYSYGNLLYNQTSEAYGKTDFRRLGSVGQFLGNLSLIYVFPAFASVLLAQAFGKGDDDDSFVEAMGREIVGQALNTMVLVREFGGYLRAANRGYQGPTGTRAIAAGYNFLTQAKQGKADRGLLRAAEDVGGILFRLPLAQVQRSIDGFVALQHGRTRNPLALVSGAPQERK